jgi:hypothetical protein
MGSSGIWISRSSRRALLIYLGTIIVPVCVLLWLGIQSFERQREALATLTAERIASATEARTREAAESAFRDPSHPLIQHRFTMEKGDLVEPVLRAPLPPPLPNALREAERLETEHPRAALAAYRKLTADPRYAAMALSRVARVLNAVGQPDEASRAWRRLADEYPDAPDPFGRPYGIVAALQAGKTAGLLEQIMKDRWRLAADQAEHFVSELGPDRADAYLDRFRFAREVAASFRPVRGVGENEVQSDVVGGRRVFYRLEPGAARPSACLPSCS